MLRAIESLPRGTKTHSNGVLGLQEPYSFYNNKVVELIIG